MRNVDDGEEKKKKRKEKKRKEKEKNGVFSGHYVIASSQNLEAMKNINIKECHRKKIKHNTFGVEDHVH